MLTEDVKLISVDDHAVESPTLWQDRLSAKHREAGPRITEGPGHTQTWIWEGRKYPFEFVGSPNSRKFRGDGTGEDFYARHYDDLSPATYDPKQRLIAMDDDGVWAQLCFPQWSRFAGTRFLEGKDKDLALACVQAYNDWMIDEWCAVASDRFIPTVILPLWDAQLCTEEVKRAADKGAKAVSFVESLASHNLPSIWTGHWDPMFAAIQDSGLILCLHIGTSGTLTYPSPESSDAVAFSLASLNAMSACTDLIFSNVFERFPELKFAMSEAGGGWAPYLVERMDYTWERVRMADKIQARPSELFKRHFWICVIKDDTAIELRHEIGVDRLMLETDFPHQDSNWPNSRRVAAEMLANVPDDEARRIAEQNARELFHI